MVENENVDSQAVALIGVIGAIITFVLIIGVQVLYYRTQKAEQFSKDVAVGSVPLAAWQAEQRNVLSSYRWVNREAEVAAIPIDQAMELTVKQLSGAAAAAPQPAAAPAPGAAPGQP